MTDDIELKKIFTVAEYMQATMNDGHKGYYNITTNIGRQGDFVTAPTLTNLFGQTIARWLINTWYISGQSTAIDLIELGPGEGLLLTDILYHLRAVPEFYKALHIKCVEINPHFKKRIQEQFTDITIEFYDNVTVLSPSQPALIIANEFLDALPIHQFVYTSKGWFERTVSVTESQLTFAVDYTQSLQQFLNEHQLTDYYTNEQNNCELGTILEVCPQAFRWLNILSQHIHNHGGAAVFIDYGAIGKSYGNTLQAVYQHQKIPLTNSPHYQCDLSAHVDFYHLHKSIHHDSIVKSLTTQREFLIHNGIIQRALSLKSQLTKSEFLQLDQTLHRLLSPEQMGHLFKVLTLTG